MEENDEAPDVVDVQPQDSVKRAFRAFPWAVLIAGLVLSAILMAAITLSTVPLSFLTVRR